jgi:hypothetical protein
LMSHDTNPTCDPPFVIRVAHFTADVPPNTAKRSSASRGSRHRPWMAMLLAGASTTAFLVGISLGHLDDAGNSRNSLDHPLPEPMQRVEVPSIAISPIIIAEARSQLSLEIQIDPADKVRDSNLLLLRGLPAGISFSEGHSTGLGAWAVPVVRLTGLKMDVTAGVSSSSAITLSLVETDGTALAEARTALVIVPESSNLSAGSAVVEESLPGAAAPPEQRGGEVGPKVATLSPLERARAEQLVVHGEQNVELGNIAFARPFFFLAADAGLARGALLLAATYDPRELSRLRVLGVQPNPAIARKWYERARQLGAVEAEERLVGLVGGCLRDCALSQVSPTN